MKKTIKQKMIFPAILIGALIVAPVSFLTADGDNIPAAPKTSQKQDQKPTQKPDQKAEKPEQKQKSDQKQKPDQKAEKPDQKQKPDQKAEKPDQKQNQKPVKPQTQKQRQGVVPKQRQGKIGPQWQIGDKWVVESTVLQTQRGSGQKKPAVKVQWRFSVVGSDKIADRTCWRVQIVSVLNPESQPIITVWIDKKTGMLVRTTSRSLIKGERTSYTETYVSSNGTTSPVFGAIPALPLDMPLFEQEKNLVKSIEPSTYEVIQGEAGTKSIDELGFACEIDQTVRKPAANLIKALDDSLPENVTVEVEIKGSNKKVHQVWAPGNPWPVYSNNGVAESRLIEFEPAADDKKE